MTDIALFLGADGASADIGILNGDIAVDDGLYTAVILSLATNRRADPEDDLPPGRDKGGWWGDAYLPPLRDGSADVYGSKLWLRTRVTATLGNAQMIRADILQALNWMMADGIASAITVLAAWNSATALAITTAITQPPASPGGQPRVRSYDLIWDKTLGLVT